jgi:hypothetical protein
MVRKRTLVTDRFSTTTESLGRVDTAIMRDTGACRLSDTVPEERARGIFYTPPHLCSSGCIAAVPA